MSALSLLVLSGWTQAPVAPEPSALPPSGEVAPAVPPATAEPPVTPPTEVPSVAAPTTESQPVPAPPGTRRLNIRAREVKFSPDDGIYQFIGEVRMETEGLVVNAAEVTYTEQTQDAVARGNVSVRTADGNVYWGNVLELHVPTRQWRFLEWSVEYPPAFLGQQFIGPVFVGGREVSGLPNRLDARDARVTTCDLPVPHYLLAAEEVEIIPGDRLIARNVDFIVLGHRVLRLKYFILWLRQRRTPIVPEAGWNQFEGYYLRLLYQYVFDPDNLGGVRLDLTEKLGVGAGVDHFYTLPGGNGEAFLYGRQGLDEYVARVDHHQQLPYDITLDFTGDVRQDSRFTEIPTTLTNINARFNRATTHSTSLFNFVRRVNQGSFASDAVNMLLRYDNITTGGFVRISEEYGSVASSGFFGESENRDLWSRLHLMRGVGFGNLNLRMDEYENLSDDPLQTTRFFGIQRLPEVYLETDENQLHLDFLQRLPSRFTVGWGSFDEQPQQTRLNRYLFNWEALPRPIVLGATTLSPTGSFRQTIYGNPDTTAQYVVSAGLNARTAFTDNLNRTFANVVTYGRQQNRGFTPFQFDATYPYETANDSLQYLTANTQTYLSSGRDLQNNRWQDITLRSDIQFTPVFGTRQAVGYDPNTGIWRDLVSEFRVRKGPDDPSLTASVGTRYSLDAGMLRRISTEVSWVISPRWKLQWLGSYDGLNKELLYNEFLLTRDLHCWDVSAYYSYQRKMVYLYFRIKALNLPLPFFGIGRAGQVLSTEQGVPF